MNRSVALVYKVTVLLKNENVIARNLGREATSFIKQIIRQVVFLAPSHGTVAAPHVRNSISHSKNDFEGIRSHNPTKLLRLNPQLKCTREISSLICSSLPGVLNRPGTFWRNHTTATLTVG